MTSIDNNEINFVFKFPPWMWLCWIFLYLAIGGLTHSVGWGEPNVTSIFSWSVIVAWPFVWLVVVVSTALVAGVLFVVAIFFNGLYRTAYYGYYRPWKRQREFAKKTVVGNDGQV